MVIHIGKQYTWHFIDITRLLNDALQFNIKKGKKDWNIVSIDIRGNDRGSLSQFHALETKEKDKIPYLKLFGKFE